MNKQEHASIKKNSQKEMVNQGGNTINLHRKTAPPSPFPNAHHSKARNMEMFLPMGPKNGSAFNIASAAVYIDDFQPTIPGFISPENHSEYIDRKAHGTNSSIENPVAGFKNYFQPTSLGHSPGAGHPLEKNQSDDADLKTELDFSSNIEHSATSFKSTALGHNAKVGRLLSKDDSKNIDPKALDASSGSEHSVAGFKDDFQHTAPNNGLGVGHSLSENSGDTNPNALGGRSSIEHSVAIFKNDFKPMAEGNSPGVGHAFPNKIAEPKA